jgi:DNA-binding transcriptional LysR family regulator
MRHKSLDLQLLQVFVVTAEERSMSVAAQRLGTTQSAISQGIRHLEEELGILLFDRRRRPLQLTAPALTLLHRGRVLLKESAQVRSDVLEASLGIAPEVSIGLVDSFAATCGPHFTKRMLERTVRLVVRSGLTHPLGEQLLSRELDIVVTTDSLEGLDGKVDRLIFSEPMVVLTPRSAKGWRLKSMDAATVRRLAAALPLIRFNTQSQMGVQVETLLRRLQVRAAPRLEVDTADTLAAMVAAGLGWAVTTPSCWVQGIQHASEVHISMLRGIHAGRSLYLLGREGEHAKLFETAYEAACDSVEHALLPALKGLAPELSGSIECGWKCR